MGFTNIGGDHIELKYVSVIEVKKIAVDPRGRKRQEILRSPLDVSETYIALQIFKSQ